jgi:NYN domain
VAGELGRGAERRGTSYESPRLTVEVQRLTYPLAAVVLFVYVDNSNVWIEGQRASAVAKGMARNAWEAQEKGILDLGWRYDFGRLYQLACPPDSAIGRSILFGSRPPPNDSLWRRAESEGFQVEVFDRSASGQEKQVDTGIVTVMLEDSYQHMQSDRGDLAVLLAGDRDYVPALASLGARGIGTRVVFWQHATARDLQEAAAEFLPLDPHLEELALSYNG